MRLFKKLAAGLFSAALALSFAAPMMPVLAADDDTVETRGATTQTTTVKLNGSIKDASYEGYLLFTGTWKDNNLGTPVLNDQIPNLAEYIIRSLQAVTGTWPSFTYYDGNTEITIGSDTTSAAAGSTLPNGVNPDGYVTGTDTDADQLSVNVDKIKSALGTERFAEQLLEKISQLEPSSGSNGSGNTTISTGNPRLFANNLSTRLAKASPAITPTLNETPVVEDSPNSTTYTATFDDVPYGYYLFANVKDVSDKTNASSTGMLVKVNEKMAGNNDTVTVKIKASVPAVDKYVSDYDSDGQDKPFQPSVDAGLTGGKGSEQISGLAYRLIGGVASNYNDYSWYHYEFVDTLPKGIELTDANRLVEGNRSDADRAQFQWAWKAYEVTNYTNQNMDLVNTDGNLLADVKDVSKSFTPTVTQSADGQSVIKWKTNTDKGLKNLSQDISNTDTYRIIIEYYPLYTQKEIESLYGNLSDGSNPDKNNVYLNFSNDYRKEDSMGKTPDVETKVYDFNLVVKKLGSDDPSNTLSGAEFTLPQSDGKDAGHILSPTQGQDGYFYWTGLDADVEYTLTETKAPDGYRKGQPVTFKFVATYDADKKNLQSVTVQSVTNPSGHDVSMLDPNDNVPLPNGSGNITGTTATVTSLITVINTLGPDLPLTGMSGIWAGIILGLVVIGGSAYFIIRNRRKAAEAEEDENEQK